MPCEEEKQGYPGHDLQGYPGQESQAGRQDMYVDPTGTETFHINYITVLIYKFKKIPQKYPNIANKHIKNTITFNLIRFM